MKTTGKINGRKLCLPSNKNVMF